LEERAKELGLINPETDKGADDEPDPREWSPPVDFGEACGPPVPLDAFPDPVARFVEEVAGSYQVPADMVALAALGVLAAAAAKRARVFIGDTHSQPLNLYVAPTAGSGERKSFLRELVAVLEAEQERTTRSDGPDIVKQRQTRDAGERRIRYLQDKAAKADDPADRDSIIREATRLELELPPPAAWPKLLCDDATPEATARLLSEQGGRLAIISEEAGSLFEILAGRYNDGVSSLDVHLKAYDGGTIDVARIGRPSLHVERPALTIIVTPQPRILDRIGEHPEFRDRGLNARFLFTLTPSLVGTRKYTNRPINSAVRRDFDDAVGRILALPLPRTDEPERELQIEGQALERWAQSADKSESELIEGGSLAHVADWVSKHPGRVARIAGLFHLLAGTDGNSIAPRAVVDAWMVGDWLAGHALAAFERMNGTPNSREARWVLEWIRRHGFAMFSLRDLYRHRSVDRPEDLLPALDELETRGFVRRLERRPTGGRPASPAYVVSPYATKSMTEVTEGRLLSVMSPILYTKKQLSSSDDSRVSPPGIADDTDKSPADNEATAPAIDPDLEWL
jgi:hypothetical protein